MLSYESWMFVKENLDRNKIMNKWPYYEHIMNICFTSKFALEILSVLSLFRPVIWPALSLLFPRDLIFFAVSNQKPIISIK